MNDITYKVGDQLVYEHGTRKGRISGLQVTKHGQRLALVDRECNAWPYETVNLDTLRVRGQHGQYISISAWKKQNR